jgi:hypothetical protein
MPDMAGLSTLRASDAGHVIHSPEDLDRTAFAQMKQLAFCTTSECKTVYVDGHGFLERSVVDNPLDVNLVLEGD